MKKEYRKSFKRKLPDNYGNQSQAEKNRTICMRNIQEKNKGYCKNCSSMVDKENDNFCWHCGKRIVK